MGGVKVNLLKARLVERDMNLLIGEVNAIVSGLKLTVQEAVDIFFTQQVA